MGHNTEQVMVEKIASSTTEVRMMQIPKSLRLRIEKMKRVGNDLSGVSVTHVDQADEGHRDFYSDRG